MSEEHCSSNGQVERNCSVVNETVAPAAEWSPVAVRLLQGVVYSDENVDYWNVLLRSVTPISDYFGKLGLQLVIDEPEGMAYLRQYDDDDVPAEYESIPKLFRRAPLSFDASLLCVLLRDELRRFDEEDVHNERCVVLQSDLMVLWKAFQGDQIDEVRLQRSLMAGLRKMEELKFVRLFEKVPPSWEIRRIIKARLPLDDLERLRVSLTEAIEMASSSESPEALHESPNSEEPN